MSQQLAERIALADKITSVKREVAAAVNDEFYRRHPDWLQRYGPAGRQRGLEDACYHVEYLAAAIEAGSTALFEAYAEWTTRVLESRGILRRFLVETLADVELSLAVHLTLEERAFAGRYLSAGSAAATRVAADDAEPQPEGPRALFLSAILRGERSAALNIAVEQLLRGASIVDLHVEICAKALWDVGELWARNRITVADEHRATAIAQYVIARLYSRIPLPELRRGNVVVAGVQGEMHQLGANIFADVLEADGWNVCFLGTNLPHKNILRKIEEHEASAICISVTMPLHMARARELVRDVRSRFGNAIKIVLGGQAFQTATQFYIEVGADACALDAREGVRLVREVTDTPSKD